MSEKTATVYVTYHYSVTVDLDLMKQKGLKATNTEIAQEADNLIFSTGGRYPYYQSEHKVVRDKPSTAQTVQKVIRRNYSGRRRWNQKLAAYE